MCNTVLCLSYIIPEHNDCIERGSTVFWATTATETSKARALPRFWISILSYKKQLVQKIWGRVAQIRGPDY